MKISISGLIKLPREPLKKLKSLVAYEFLWWARTALEGKREEFPDHAKAYDKLYRKLSPLLEKSLPKRSMPRIDNSSRIHSRFIKVDTKGVPKRYKLRPDAPKVFKVRFEWIPSNTVKRSIKAGWLDDDVQLIFFMGHIDELLVWPKLYGPNRLFSVWYELVGIAEHELTHGMQRWYLPEEQSAHNTHYRTDVDDYLTSPVEFDPLIKTAIADYADGLRNLRENVKLYGKGMDERDYFSYFIDEHEEDQSEDAPIVYRHPFFKALKRRSIKKWRLAVKKFTEEVDKAGFERKYGVPK